MNLFRSALERGITPFAGLLGNTCGFSVTALALGLLVSLCACVCRP